jgi:hypothetical protein
MQFRFYKNLAGGHFIWQNVPCRAQPYGEASHHIGMLESILCRVNALLLMHYPTFKLPCQP